MWSAISLCKREIGLTRYLPQLVEGVAGFSSVTRRDNAPSVLKKEYESAQHRHRGNKFEDDGDSQEAENRRALRKQRALDLKIASRVIAVDGVRKTTAGGRVNNFRAAVVAGNGNGLGGFGVATGPTVKLAVAKAYVKAKKDWVYIDLTDDNGLYVDLLGKHNSTRVLMRSTRPESGIRAGREVKGICEVMGIQNVVTKVIGRRNTLAVINACFDAFSQHRTPEELSVLRGRRIIRAPRWYK